MSIAAKQEVVTIKKYANRRLYNTATSTYVTLGDLSAMVKEGIEFNVYDAKTGEDITRSVLTQIIVEEEGKSGQQNLLPISFLRQLIGFYGDNMQWMVPKYLEQSMEQLSKNQDQMRGYFKSTFGSVFPFGSTLEEMSKQNMAMFERAMQLFSPFNQGLTPPEGKSSSTQNPEAAATSTGENEPDEGPEPALSPETSAFTFGAGVTGAMSPQATVTPMPRRHENPNDKPDEDRPDNSGTNSRSDIAPAASSGTATPAYTAEKSTPMPNVASATQNSASSADDMQNKIANLQKQLADLAKGRG